MPKIENPIRTEGVSIANDLFGEGNGPYTEIRLAKTAGLTQFGVNIEILPPGSRSSTRHWHEAEDEFVYVLSGEAVLIEDEETILKVGDSAAWPAGAPVGHCLENRSDEDVSLLIVGSRKDKDIIHYPEKDVVAHKDDGNWQLTNEDGAPLKSPFE